MCSCELCDIERDAEQRERARVCDDCDKDLTDAQMWEGKRTGRKLCDACFERWRKAGRAKEGVA